MAGATCRRSSGATGSDGKASATRTLGGTAGQQLTIAAVSGLQGSPVSFTATATEGAGGEGITITNNPPTAALTGEVFDPVAQPMVQVNGTGGQPAAGVEVTASVCLGRRDARRHHYRHDRCLGRREVRRPRHPGHRRADARVHGRNQQRDLGPGQPLAAAGGGHDGQVGPAGELGHRAAAHASPAQRQAAGVGQVRARRHGDGDAEALGSRERAAYERHRGPRGHDAVLLRARLHAGRPAPDLRRPQAG